MVCARSQGPPWEREVAAGVALSFVQSLSIENGAASLPVH